MAQEIADSTLLDTWASSGVKIEPDISKIIEGWQLGEQPPHEYMNWLQNTFGSKLNHVLKNGVAIWNNETQYLAGSSVQHNGNVWLCKVTNTNSAPTDVNANWKIIITVEALTAVLAGYVATTGNQTIAGVKTFSSIPTAPTAPVGTISAQLATTAFVDAENTVLRQELGATGGAGLIGTRSGVDLQDSLVGSYRMDAIRNAIVARVGAGSFNFVVLGDSTECGVGAGGASYGETTLERNNSHLNRLAYAMITADPDFVPPYVEGMTVRFPGDTGHADRAYPNVVMTVNDNPSVTFEIRAKSKTARESEIAVYYMQRTADTAARALVTAYNAQTGAQIAQGTLDSYVDPVTFGSAGTFNVAGRLAKFTLPLQANPQNIKVVIDNLDVIDRGSGVEPNGTLWVYGVTKGAGIGFHNLAVSSTTLTEGSDANIMKGVDTSERIALLKSLDADVVYIGWGTNDSKVGVTNPEQFRQDYVELIEDLKIWKPTVIIILGTDPKGLGSPYENNPVYNQIIREVGEFTGCPVFDVEEIFSNGPSAYYSDAVHPSGMGYQALEYAMRSFIGLGCGELSAQPRKLGGVLSWTIPVGSDFSGDFIDVISQDVVLPSWARGYTVTATVNLAMDSSDLVDSAAKIEVNGFTRAEKVVSVPQVSGTAIGNLELFDTHDFETAVFQFNVKLKLRNYNIRLQDSRSRLFIRFH